MKITRILRGKRGIMALAGLALAAALGVTSAPMASASAVLYFPLNDYKSDLCLGIAGGSTANGASALQWNCNNHPDQSWAGIPSSVASGYLELVNLDDKCLGIAGGSTAEGTHAVAWSCNNHRDQQWYPVIIQNHPPYVYEFKNLGSGMCLGISGGSTAVGADALQWNCNGNSDQKWFQSNSFGA